MKKLIKSLVPPILWDKLLYIRSYKHFLKYKDLVTKNIALKDKHKGKRCFILGSGPSIKKEDLKPLKNEIVFALNNFYVHEDFAEIMSSDVDKYYMTAPIHPPQTEEEWKRWFEDMESHMPQNTNMLFGLNAYDGNIRYIFEKYGIFKEHKINWYFAGVNTGEYYNFNKKDIDMTNMIWSANTVSIYALIAAIYMGFDEIYLLGMDHNYMCKSENDWRFYKDAIHQKDETKRIMQDKSHTQHVFKATGKIFEHYQILKDNNRNKIYNCSDESLLDIFEHKNIGEILK
jgi:hypothetical protein